MLVFMSDYLEEIVYFTLPVLFFLVVRFVLRTKSNLPIVHYFVVSLVVGILSAIFGPRCLCSDLNEKVFGAIFFAGAVAVITSLAFLFVDLYLIRHVEVKNEPGSE